MENIVDELQASETLPTETDDSLNVDNNAPDELGTLNQQVAELTEKNKKLFERTKRAEENLKKRGEETSDPTQFVNRNEWLLGQQGYSIEETKKIIGYSKGLGVSVEDALKDPFIQSAVSSLREKKDSNAATPEPSSRVSTTKQAEAQFAHLAKNEQKADWRQSLEGARKKRLSREVT